MTQNNDSLNDQNLRRALLRFDSRFNLPDDFISSTMAEINAVAERRAYIRGIFLISFISLSLCAAAALMLYIAGFTLMIPSLSLGHIFTEVADSTSFAASFITSPLILFIIFATIILLSLDHLMRRIYRRHHA